LHAPFFVFDDTVRDGLVFSRDYPMIKMRGCHFLMVLPAAEDVLRSSTLTF
jgi:hypothetical protein